MKTKIGLLGLVMSFLFIGCNKDDQNNAPMSADDLAVNANLDEMSEDVSKVAEDAYYKVASSVGKSSIQMASYLPECAQIGYSDTAENWVRTIDFGAGCELPNGNVLKGKIIISGSNNMGTTPYTINCTFDNFYHNGFSVQGNKILIRSMESTANLETSHPVLTMNINLKVTALNGVVRNITGERVREMIEGLDTPQVLADDVYLISGSQSVNSPKGTIITTITTPLEIRMNCNHIVQGVISFDKNNKIGTLDYGNGNCDDQAVVTVNGVPTDIKIGK